MPKMKTHKGTQKRVKITATGKVMVRPMNPKRAKRSRSKLHVIRRNVQADESVTEAVFTNLPYARRG